MLAKSNEFRNVSFSHVRQQGNRLGHLLAKQALGLIDLCALMEECPCFLEQVLIHHFSCI